MGAHEAPREVIPASVRTGIYGVCVALVPLATAYGIVDKSTGALWLAFVGSVLSIGTATVYRPTRKRGERAGTPDLGRSDPQA